jgi:signal transduction histidine kinase
VSVGAADSDAGTLFGVTMQGMKQDRVAERVTIRAAVLVGLAVTLGLWIFAGYQVTLRMQAAQRDGLAASERYLQAQELLASVRTEVLVASVLVRDALLNPDAGTVGSNRQALQRSYDTIDHQLARYVPFVGSPSERERVGRLRDEVKEFRAATDEVLATDSRGWPRNAGMLLRRFMPRREAAIRISEEVQALNRAAFIEQQQTINAMQSSMQRQVWIVFGVASVISLGIGWLAFRHSARLERRLTEQRGREEQIASDLQRLSARLLHAQEEEQRRIARELHDEVGQLLSAVKMELAVAGRKLERAGGTVQLLSDAESSVDTALHSVRNLSHLLHPSALDDLGLVVALESQLADFRRRHEIVVEFVHTGMEGRHSDETERAVYRIVQEALTNIARHAHASTARVALDADASHCRVIVEDDGIGFDVSDAERPGSRRGLGLLGIRERVTQLQGTVTIESRRSSGTRIEVDLPQLGSIVTGEPTGDVQLEPSFLEQTPEVGHG